MAQPAQIITYKIESDYFQTLLRQYQASARALQNGAKRINERAVRDLSGRAQKELRRRIRQRGRQQSRNKTLVDLAGDYRRNSIWDSKGFHFFVPSKVTPIAPYYRAIELGSRHMVGRYIPLTFFRGGTQILPPAARLQQVRRGAGQPGGRVYRPGGGAEQRAVRATQSATRNPDGSFTPNNEVGDSLRDYATYSGRRGTPYVVQIRRPIRAYLYISTAVDNFMAEDAYSKIVESEVRRLAPLLAKHMK